MKKTYIIGVVIILLGILTAGAGAVCFDETNPQCYVCKAHWLAGSWCGIVVGDDTGKCNCNDGRGGPYSWCSTSGEFCGMIIVVG